MKFLALFLSFLTLNSLAQNLKGVWQRTENGRTTTIIATENYLTVNAYELEGKKFIESWGGKYEVGVTNEVFIEVDFHSNNPSIVNSSQSYNINLKKKNLEFAGEKYAKVGAQNDNALSGLWRITARANENGEMNPMNPGPRKTYKIMSGGYFQWFAINTQTREFFGTGGGKYTLEGKVYTENIEFFSRDSNRVGAVLSFEAEVKDKEWIHSGKSSKGDPIKEIWTKQ
ncbi:membrane or secreted protein [Lacihabitans sp. LS3-19]|uniref:membrane or secreted protein n=1 Tax=Lacihabitans sp. LS3-19 TaxID=2487335 RepID=UPI0020CE810D|nr:membrane or secreted protein [Lacihabitans sp. LS3-19]MCP9770849.1 membrane or secreted protein [Lacihabitans sp. LS3-19]